MNDTLQQIQDEYNVNPPDIVTVSELNEFVSLTLSRDDELQHVHVLGEVSNMSKSSQGYLFFDLKEDSAMLSCVCFSQQDDGYRPKDGDKVLVKGSIDYYQKKGSLSLKVTKILPVGEGMYYRKLRERMKKLENEGLFDDSEKQRLPRLPERIGIVTSADGAAVEDINDSIVDRFPNIDVIVKHAAVQGEHAVEQLINGIRYFDEHDPVDTIIVGRGGGSIEDLQAFNTEDVARAIHNCNTPVISGVGHRTDETITGKVADYGAITPTEAGKEAVPDGKTMLRDLAELEKSVDERYRKFRQFKEHEEALQQSSTREKLYIGAIAVLVIVLAVLLWVVL